MRMWLARLLFPDLVKALEQLVVGVIDESSDTDGEIHPDVIDRWVFALRVLKVPMTVEDRDGYDNYYRLDHEWCRTVRRRWTSDQRAIDPG